MGNPAPTSGNRLTLLGRADECTILDGLVADIRRGEGRTLVKTVALHLTHSYEKLGIGGRPQLPTALGDTDTPAEPR
jgi:hypothetical protein